MELKWINRDNDTIDHARRNFVKALGIGAAAAGSIAAFGTPGDASASVPGLTLDLAHPRDVALWQEIKNAFVLDPKVTYMNVGTTGSMPRSVLEAFYQNSLLIAQNPRETLGGSTAMRAALAPQFGCNLDELVISNNTTDGVCMTLNGLGLEKGDEIIATNHEHAAATAPMKLLRDRRGVKITEVHLPVGDAQTADDYVELFREALRKGNKDKVKAGKVKLFVFSAPTYITGTMLPIRRLADLAIEHGIYTLVDGAHATGMFNLDFHALGVDFFAGSGHKWQCGPGGSGLWYIRNQTDSNPLALPRFYPTRTSLYDASEALRGGAPDGARGGYDVARFNQSHGNPNYPAYRALVDVCHFWTAIGRQAIEDHILDLSAYLKNLIVEHWGVDTLYSPRDPELSSALTTFTPFPSDRKNAAKFNEFVNRLRTEYGFVVRNTSVHLPGEPDDLAIRISTHLFHDYLDVDSVVKAMVDLTDRMGG